MGGWRGEGEATSTRSGKLHLVEWTCMMLRHDQVHLGGDRVLALDRGGGELGGGGEGGGGHLWSRLQVNSTLLRIRIENLFHFKTCSL